MNTGKKVYFYLKNKILPVQNRLIFNSKARLNIFLDKSIPFDSSSSIIVNGFWRSGTTLTQDLLSHSLRCKSFFEPFEPGLPEEYKFISEFALECGFDVNDRKTVAVLMPFIGKKTTDELIWKYLDSVVLGNYSNAGLTRNRKSVFDALYKGKCIKFVRGHFILYELAKRYNLPIVHIQRNPLAVIGSLIKVPHWNQGGFEDIDLSRILSSHFEFMPKRLAPVFRQFETLPKYLTKVEKIAAYWAIVEIIAEHQIRDIGSKGTILQFENLISNKHDALNEVYLNLNIKPKRIVNEKKFAEQSKTTHYQILRKEQYDPLKAYKKVLSLKDIEKILNILNHFNLGWKCN